MGNCFNISNIPVASPVETDNIITVIGIPYAETDISTSPSAPPMELMNIPNPNIKPPVNCRSKNGFPGMSGELWMSFRSAKEADRYLIYLESRYNERMANSDNHELRRSARIAAKKNKI